MQTFLPYPDFAQSARSLDRKRLGKQRVEVYQILKALAGETTGWVNHPITKAWRGFESQLVAYGLAVCDEWIARGYRDTTRAKIAAYGAADGPSPPWLGTPDLHAAYRSLLVFKAPRHYRDEMMWMDRPAEEIDYETLFQSSMSTG